MRRSFLLVTALLALPSASCLNIDVLEEDVCGNGVIDPGEDCDSLEIDGFDCLPPSNDWRCSFACNAKRECPVGYGCGADDVCRRATGEFGTDAFAKVASQAQELMAGDFDADRHEDVVAVEPGRLRIGFVGESGDVQQVSISSLDRPSIGKLGPLVPPGEGDPVDETDDVVVQLNLGVGSLISQGDGTFTSKTYGSITFAGEFDLGDGVPASVTAALPVAFDALPGDDHTGDETGALFGLQATIEGEKVNLTDGVFVAFASADDPIFIAPGVTPRDLAGSPVTASFDTDPCSEIVFPKKGTTEEPWTTLSVYKVCVEIKSPDPDKPPAYRWRSVFLDPGDPTIALIDVGANVSGPAFAVDANSDGAMDLVATVSPEEGLYELRIAYGLGNGKFDSKDPLDPTPPQAAGNNQASLYAKLDGGPPLALGKLNPDKFPDIVDATRILVGRPGGVVPLAFDTAYTSQRPWTEAVITNINGDEFTDVVASADGGPNIDVLSGNTSKFFNPVQVSTDGTVAHLTVGDFDGDLVNDIAFQDLLSQDASLLTISYGQPSGGPEAPVTIGEFPNIQLIVRGDVHDFGVDDIDDLGVVSTITGDAPSMSFFPGAGNRLLQTPFLLTDENTLEIPLRTGLGPLLPSPQPAHNDLAVIAFDPPTIDPSDPQEVKIEKQLSALVLWGLYGTGEGDFDTTRSGSCRMPTGAFYLPALSQATSVIVVTTGPGEPTRTFVAAPFLQLIEPGPQGPKGVEVHSLLAEASFFEAAAPGGEACKLPADPPLTLSGQMLFRLRTADLDGNGKPEILGLLKKFTEEQLVGLAQQGNAPGASPFEGAAGSELVVFWDAALGNGQELAPYAPSDQPEFVVDYAVGDIDGDGRTDVIVVGADGAKTYSGVKGSPKLQAGPALDHDLAGAKAILLSDVDGDGVKDLVVAASGLELYKGMTKPPVTKVAEGTP